MLTAAPKRSHKKKSGPRKRREYPPFEQRFWAKVLKTPSCWLWQGATAGRGYGVFGTNRDGLMYAHRFSYELHCGPIGDGLVILHTCDTPNCVNPVHLVAGTQRENVLDMIKKGRRRLAKKI